LAGWNSASSSRSVVSVLFHTATVGLIAPRAPSPFSVTSAPPGRCDLVEPLTERELEVRGFSAIETGLLLTPATVGILLSSTLAGRLAKRYPQRTLIWSGFVITIVEMILLLLFARATSNILTFVPGLLLMGVGVGAMLTSSVNVVQSSFPKQDQGEISGLSRSGSNLGSSLGTAIAGSVLVSTLVTRNRVFGLALATIAVIAGIGLFAAVLLPRETVSSTRPSRNHG
jgi:MFS family permease